MPYGEFRSPAVLIFIEHSEKAEDISFIRKDVKIGTTLACCASSNLVPSRFAVSLMVDVAGNVD